MPSQRAAPGGGAFNDHLGGYRLWLYCLSGMSEPDRAPIEEHLLVCEACRDRLDIVDALACIDLPK